MLQVAGLNDRLIDIALYIYIAGIVGTSLYHLWGFSQGIKILTSIPSSIFMGLEVCKSILKSFLWPATGLIFLLQLPFSQATVEDFNKSVADYTGYDLEDDNDEEED